MNKNILICTIVVLILCGGCGNRYLKPTSECQPLSAFDTIVIAPIDGDSAFVEEAQYRHLPHDLALATTDSLKIR